MQYRVKVDGTGLVTAAACSVGEVPPGLTAFNAHCEQHNLVPANAGDDGEDSAIVKMRVDRRWSSQSLADKISKRRAAKKERFLEGQKEREDERKKKLAKESE